MCCRCCCLGVTKRCLCHNFEEPGEHCFCYGCWYVDLPLKTACIVINVLRMVAWTGFIIWASVVYDEAVANADYLSQNKWIDPEVEGSEHAHLSTKLDFFKTLGLNVESKYWCPFWIVVGLALCILEAATLVSVVLKKANVLVVWITVNNLVFLTEFIAFVFYAVWIKEKGYMEGGMLASHFTFVCFNGIIMMYTAHSSCCFYRYYDSVVNKGLVLAEPDHLNLENLEDVI